MGNRTTMDIPEWAKKHQTKGTTIETHKTKNGTTNYYLRKITSKYNKQKHRAQKISGQYLGKITPEGLIPPKQQQIKNQLVGSKITLKEHGATQLILNTNQQTINHLKTHYPTWWKEILTIAIFRLIHQTPLKNTNFYYQTSYLSETLPNADLTSKTLGPLLRKIGTERETITNFMHHYIQGSKHVAVDLTHVFSLSENVISSTLGHNSKGEYVPQINLFYLFSLDRMMPAYFRVVVGSVNSVKTLKLSIKESKAENAVVVGDKGFYSEANVEALEQANLQYVLPLKRNSSLLDYGVIKLGDKSKFGGFFRYGRRVIWFYEYKELCGGRRVVVFLDERLKVEEEKDVLGRIDEDRFSGEGDALEVERRLSLFYENQFRFGTIGVVTSLGESACEVFEVLKSRVDIEQMYDSFKNVLRADRMFVRDDFQVEGWMFVNFVALLFYYQLRNMLVERKLLARFSVLDILVHLSRIYKIKIGNDWELSEIPKKTLKILEKLDKHITKNLQS